MGYLLKEALKTLCGVNQWSYAVFWKFGCQNPKLLVWEECYYENTSPTCLGLPVLCGENLDSGFDNYNDSWVSVESRSLQRKVQARDKVRLLVNKMMMDSHVVISGEGLVGRVAFMGSHQWILSENYDKEAHPPEVLKELCRQFSAGIQTMAVIPVLPHGVVQFGSLSTVMENLGFVNDVMSLVLQLTSIPGVFPSENYAANEQDAKIGIPNCLGNSTSGLNRATCLLESSGYVGYSDLQPSVVNGQASFPVVKEMQNDLLTDGVAFQAVGSTPGHCRTQETNVGRAPKPEFSSLNQSMFGVAKAQVIPSNPKMLINGNASPFNPSLCVASHKSMRCTEQRVPDPGTFNMSSTVLNMPELKNPGSMYSLSNGLASHVSVDQHGHFCAAPGNLKAISSADLVSDLKQASDGNNTLKNVNPMKWEDTKSDSVGLLRANSLLEQNNNDLGTANDDAYAQPTSGDDLFDVLGSDYKNKVLSGWWNNLSDNESTPKRHNMDKHFSPSKKSSACSEIYSTSQGNSDSGIFSSSGIEDLLEAVVSQIRPSAKQRMDDNVSCKTTLTGTSISSAPNATLPYDQSEALAMIKGELFGVPKYVAKAGAASSCSLRNVSSKEESAIHSQGSSIYGSQISSWIENNQMAKLNNSVSTGHSKKPHEISKPNRKRLKPGENPRPRPKDRQMIQDRVKELREIVPNGAKCSIDSLLERTIKHMLFLQSVMKHADKLKQAGDSKIMSKDGGVTWAYEVGAQSMVCPIRVEDLNQPRQMLVEMLCDESGLFLEIADIIRGLGLTILKGLMETRDNKIWSRFTVEANRDVTRMEIFLSLVHLLEQSSKPGAVQPNENQKTPQLNAPDGISPNLQ